MNIFKTSTPAEQVAKAETQLAAATETHAHAVQALDSALGAELDGSGEPKATTKARQAVAVAVEAVAHQQQLLTVARAKQAAVLAATAEAEQARAATAKRARIAALVKSRGKLGELIDAQALSIAEDYLQLDRETVELCELIGRKNTQDYFDEVLAPYRLQSRLMNYWGTLHAPWAPKPMDPNAVQRFMDVIHDSNAGLLARAKGGL
jgi:hypothetical protein